VAYFPISNSHYVENTGDEDLIYLEVLQADHFSGELPARSLSFYIRCDFHRSKSLIVLDVVDISLGQWLGETPKQIVQDTLNLSDKSLAQLRKEKLYVVQGKTPET
jgi:oxalate decarboxylase/phosphoglucose isomerase-like protein (cupin superfamily)